MHSELLGMMWNKHIYLCKYTTINTQHKYTKAMYINIYAYMGVLL